MRHRAENVLGQKILPQLVDVGAQLLDHAKLLFADAEHQDVHFATVFRKVGGRLVRDECARQVGDFQRAANAVVIGDGDEIHPPLPRAPVHLQRLDKALRRADAAQEPFARPVRVLAMDVKIGLRWLWAVHWAHSSLPGKDCMR